MTAVAPATRREVVAAAAEILGTAGIESARQDAEWLLAGVLGVRRSGLYLEADRILSPAAARAYALAVERRRGREPLQRILGWEEFHGLPLRLTPAVLVPRPETEVLAEWALALLPPPVAGRRPLVVDLGTGSGCIACALAGRRVDLRILALDASVEAARVAGANADALGFAGRVRAVAGDMLGALRAGTAEMVVSNPPYLPTRLIPALTPEVADHEPRQALDGGPDGLAVIRRLIGEARSRLVPGGVLALETAGGEQITAVAGLLNEAGFRGVVVHNDLAGITRFIAGRV
jgi:release factor glutamine methyltransferase